MVMGSALSHPIDDLLMELVDPGVASTHSFVLAIGEGRPSRWKDGLTRSFVHHSPIADWKGGSKLLAKGVLGPRL